MDTMGDNKIIFNKNVKNVLITGLPGVGKTTLVAEVLNRYPSKFGGFYTKEVRTGGIREGFKICTTEGTEKLFASVNFTSKYKVSKYAVDLEVLESVGVKSLLDALKNKKIILIDEIGKMECFSSKFKDVVLQCFSSNKKVLATIKLAYDEFTRKLKLFPNTKVLELTKQNYTEIKEFLFCWVKTSL